jgi:O-glycosyl hydrolase
MYTKLFKLVIIAAVIPITTVAQQTSQQKKPTVKPVVITIDATKKAQVIQNFGAAGCWNAEAIGKFWPAQKKERIAELLFSQEIDQMGNPKGIGLSAWRFNIGAGTSEQGDSSGMPSIPRRVECFQNPDGTYDWSKQEGYIWFVKKAKQYGVNDLIAFVNSPPVQMTKNGYGYKTVEDYISNLKPDQYNAFTDFLAEVLLHFEKEGLKFNYISPVNEPQWKWLCKFGDADQEGSPYTNAEIYKVVKALDSSLTAKKVSSKILMPESGTLTYLYGGGRNNNMRTANQIQEFWGKGSPFNLEGIKHMDRVIGAHSYFTELGDSSLISIRRHVADTARKYGVDFWQTEYCMLADGFREGSKEKRSAIDCALFLSKVIHHDLTVGNATAWQFWNAFEPGKTDFDLRYYLIALQPDKDNRDGKYTAVKTLWALGNYSLFIRPGMHRLLTDRSDHLTPLEEAQQLMVSSFADDKGKLVIVITNYSNMSKTVKIDLKNFKSKVVLDKYITSSDENMNMKLFSAQNFKNGVNLPSKSIVTLVLN